MARNADDPFEQAKALYREKLTPVSTGKIRTLLERFVAHPGRGHPSGEVAYGWSLLANIKLCDYLNRWNKAGQAELDTAASDITKALSIDPNHPSFAYYAEGFLHRAKGDHEAAQQAFQQSLAHGGAVRARAQSANELVYLGQPEAAVQAVDAAIAESLGHPALGMFHWIKGRALFFAADYEKAIPCFCESIKSWQALWYNRLHLASAYALTGRQRKAYRELRDFDEQFPGHATLAQVKQLERTTPNETLFVVVGRRNFHTGLRLAGRI
ncbi:MAG: tetratricopeptide repeat protein [Stellaceae bacterium]